MKKFLFLLVFMYYPAFAYPPVPFVQDNKVGYIDSSGKIIIEPKFDTPFHKLFLVFEQNSFPSFEFPDWAYFSEGKATVRIAKKFWFITYGYKYAVINEKGEFLFEPTEDIIGKFQDGVAPYQNLMKTAEYVHGEKFGMINSSAEIFIEPKYDYISHFSNNRALVRKGDKYGYINNYGELAIPFLFIDAGKFSNGIAFAKRDNLYGYIDTTGNFIIPEKFQKAWDIINGTARYYDGNLFSFLKFENNGDYVRISQLTANKFTDASDFSEGLACVRDININLYGFINNQGKYIIEPQFLYAAPFQEGLAVAKKDKYFGFIDKSGNFVISPEFDYAQNFYNGIAKVWKNNKLILINKNNHQIYSFTNKF